MINNIVIQRVICLLIGYVLGNFATGFFIGKMKGIDIRKEGSGGTGATNSLRTLGTGYGFLVLLIDCLKCVLAAVIAMLIFKNITADYRLLMLYASVGCIVGHDFPFILNFKGGKGVACALGLVIINCPICIPVCAIVFIGLVAITKYVSLGSIIAQLVLAISFIIFNHMNILLYTPNTKIEADILVCLFVALSIFLHRSNIKRLINHNENKLSFKKK